jgi:hypothetical protein
MRDRTHYPSRPVSALLCPLAIAIASGCSGDSAGSDEPPAHNLLLITLDTTRPDFISAYGDSGEPTPHIDALAADGIRFEEAVSASAVTPVSHATILSDRFP